MKISTRAPVEGPEAKQQVTVNRMYPKYINVTTSIDTDNCRKFLKNCIVQHRSHVKEAQEKSLICRISKTAPKVNIFRRQGAV